MIKITKTIPNYYSCIRMKTEYFIYISILSYIKQRLINTKESLRELVLEAESIVLQNINDRTSKTEYFFNEIIATKSPYHKSRGGKKLMDKSFKDTAKLNRVQVSLKC
jgi:hypothetical protein